MTTPTSSGMRLAAIARGSFVAALGFAALLAAAQPALQATQSPSTVDARAIAHQVCAPCHGADGNSRTALYPILAGQNAAYLHDQLRQFAAQGRRPAGGVMGAFALSLDDVQMASLADYFASQAPAAPAGEPDAANRRGKAIFFEGLPGKNVPACASCHGLRGTGLAPRFPRIAGQYAGYLAAQLAHYRAGDRISDRQGLMRQVAARLSDRDIAAVAAYVSAMH